MGRVMNCVCQVCVDRTGTRWVVTSEQRTVYVMPRVD